TSPRHRNSANEALMNRIEVLTRGNCPPSAELAPGVQIRILASGSLGARDLTTALASFQPRARLSYHLHAFSEAIVVLSGQPEVRVQGRRYRLNPYDALHLPAGTAHEVSNPSADSPAVLHSSFASDTPTREQVATAFPESDRDEPDASG